MKERKEREKERQERKKELKKATFHTGFSDLK